MKLTMSMFATKEDYWKARAEKAEAALNNLMREVFTCGNRSMTMEGRTFTAKDGFISDENFDFDAGMQVTGDFVGDEKQQYAEMIAEALNSLTHNAEVNGGRLADRPSEAV